MCPDQQILSLYVDNELPSPWKEKFEAHLEICGNCQSGLARYQKLRRIMRGDGVELSGEAKRRVWNRIAGERTAFAGPKIYSTRSRTIWSRSVSLPIPAAAAAAVVFMLAAFLAIQGIRSSPSQGNYQAPGIASGLNADAQSIPVSDMNDVLQYLSKGDTTDQIVIQLPETRSFSSAGQPALIKAADYSRRNSQQ